MEKSCRICKDKYGILLPIFEEFLDGGSYCSEIYEYLRITITRDDDLSDRICHNCVFDLSLCSSLRKKYSNYLSDTSGSKPDDRCYLCGASSDLTPLEEEALEYIQKAKNCFKCEEGSPPWENTDNKQICLECIFFLDTICQLYSKANSICSSKDKEIHSETIARNDSDTAKKGLRDDDNLLYNREDEKAFESDGCNRDDPTNKNQGISNEGSNNNDDDDDDDDNDSCTLKYGPSVVVSTIKALSRKRKKMKACARNKSSRKTRSIPLEISKDVKLSNVQGWHVLLRDLKTLR